MEKATETGPAPSGGLLLIDKSKGMTSHDVVATVRKHIRPLRVGHTGTLDPLASGLLILCVGAATKIASFIETEHKLYHAVMRLGIRTDTQDISGHVIAESSVDNITEDRVRTTAQSFVGAIEQTPPAFSALKVKGVPAYRLARRQREVRLKPRRVEIRRLEVETVSLPLVSFLVECSKGTYVRTICSDFGAALGVGGCLQELRRIAVGRFEVAAAKSVEEMNTTHAIMRNLLPVSEALSDLPALACDENQAGKLLHGMPVTVSHQVAPPECDSWAQAFGPDGELLAVGTLSRSDDACVFHPKRVLKSG